MKPMKRSNPIVALVFGAFLLAGCEGIAALGGALVSTVGQAGIGAVQEKAQVRAAFRAERNRLVGIMIQSMVSEAGRLYGNGEYDKSMKVWDDVFARLDAAMPKWLLPQLLSRDKGE